MESVVTYKATGSALGILALLPAACDASLWRTAALEHLDAETVRQEQTGYPRPYTIS
jgi:hypothetical protein